MQKDPIAEPTKMSEEAPDALTKLPAKGSIQLTDGRKQFISNFLQKNVLIITNTAKGWADFLPVQCHGLWMYLWGTWLTFAKGPLREHGWILPLVGAMCLLLAIRALKVPGMR